MNKKNEELKLVIENYVNDVFGYQELYNYAWDKIADFEKTTQNLINSSEDAGIYWYAIWQIQHLADLEHKNAGLLDKELFYILDILNGKKRLPKDRYGKPPL